MTPSYPSNLTQDQWELLEPLLPSAKPGGAWRSVDLQAIVNAILYVLCAGGAGANAAQRLPELENGLSLFSAVALWRKDGTWVEVNHQLHGLGTSG